MGTFRLLPWVYGVRNLFRRPSRTLLTLLGLALVVLLVVGFISLGGIAVRNGILLVTHYFQVQRSARQAPS